MAVGNKNVPDISQVSAQGVHGIGDPVSTTGNASTHKSQTVRVGVEEECVDARQAYAIQTGLDRLDAHRGWLFWAEAQSLADSASRSRCAVSGEPRRRPNPPQTHDLTRRGCLYIMSEA